MRNKTTERTEKQTVASVELELEVEATGGAMGELNLTVRLGVGKEHGRRAGMVVLYLEAVGEEKDS